MKQAIINTCYEVEILSDNSNIYSPGEYWQAIEFIDNFLNIYDDNALEVMAVNDCDVPEAVGHICRMLEIKANLHSYQTTKTTQSSDEL